MDTLEQGGHSNVFACAGFITMDLSREMEVSENEVRQAMVAWRRSRHANDEYVEVSKGRWDFVPIESS
jgi:hypothetical protein